MTRFKPNDLFKRSTECKNRLVCVFYETYANLQRIFHLRLLVAVDFLLSITHLTHYLVPGIWHTIELELELELEPTIDIVPLILIFVPSPFPFRDCVLLQSLLFTIHILFSNPTLNYVNQIDRQRLSNSPHLSLVTHLLLLPIHFLLLRLVALASSITIIYRYNIQHVNIYNANTSLTSSPPSFAILPSEIVSPNSLLRRNVPNVSRALRAEFARGDGRVKRKEDDRRKIIQPSETLFVVNFHEEKTRSDDLRLLFEPFGELLRIDMRRNYAFVQFRTIEEATKAKDAVNGGKLDQSVLTVEFVANQARRGGGGGDERRSRDGGGHRDYRRDDHRGGPSAGGRGRSRHDDYRRRSPPSSSRGHRGSSRSRSRSPPRHHRSRSPHRGRDYDEDRRRSPDRDGYRRRSPGRDYDRGDRGDRGYRV